MILSVFVLLFFIIFLIEAIWVESFCTAVMDKDDTAKTSSSLFSSPDEPVRIPYQGSYCDIAGATWLSWDYDLIPLMNKSDETEIARIITSAIPVPSPGDGYVCNECEMVDAHYSCRCPKAAHDGLTPYEGNKRSFGLFKCQRCYKKWYSYECYKNVGEECSKCCRGAVYPFKMYDLKNKTKIAEVISKIKSKSN